MTACTYTAARPKICECANRKCRAEVWLTWSDYKRLSAQGRVVSPGCAVGHVRWVNAGTAAVTL